MRKGPVLTTMLLCCFGLAALVPAISRAAEDKPNITLALAAEKEVREAGGVKLEPAERTEVGDVILYTISYKNGGRADARNVEIKNPIPKGAVYQLGSAGGADAKVMASLDSGVSYAAPPLRIKIVDASGKEKDADAPPEAYTDLKWTITRTISPGEGGAVWFRVKVK